MHFKNVTLKILINSFINLSVKSKYQKNLFKFLKINLWFSQTIHRQDCCVSRRIHVYLRNDKCIVLSLVVGILQDIRPGRCKKFLK